MALFSAPPAVPAAAAESGDSNPPTMSQRLRAETQAVHREAERSGFLAELIRGRGSRAGYVLYLRNLLPIYTALEERLPTGAQTSILQPFGAPGLRRAPRLAADLAGLAGPGFATDLPVLPEARRYAQAIEECDDIGLAAHAYTRYLGDLNGGQILRGLVAKTLALPDVALTFHAFPDIGDIAAVKDGVRRALDRLDVGGRAADTLVAVAKDAFRFNIELSVAVARARTSGAENVASDSIKPLRKE